MSARGADIESRVRAMLARQFQVAADSLARATTFEELGADSADFVELQISLREVFDLEVPDAAAERIRTVGDLLGYVRDALARCRA